MDFLTSISPGALRNSRIRDTAVQTAMFLVAALSTPAALALDAASPNVEATRGAYLAVAGDCAACHSVPKGAPFAGGLALQSPFGAIFSTNITPDREHGIGEYSYDDFATALRKGIAKGGRHLYPAMPYPSFSKINDEDMHALYAYFMQAVKPASTANMPNHLTPPFNIRALMIGWNLLYRPSGVFQPDAQKSAAWNRGAYLVEGLEHCGACHTPHGAAQQEKSLADRGDHVYLSGNNVDGWNAPNLRSDSPAGLGRWSAEEIVAFLRAGRNAHTAAFGPMSEAVGDSTQRLTDADLTAIATYLKELTPKAETSSAPMAGGEAAPATLALRGGHLDSAGATVYLNSCNACHRSDGSGASEVFPALAGNSVVQSVDPTSLIHMVLTGSHMPSTTTSPAPIGMPGFGWRLDDRQVADVLTFVRGSWSNRAPPVTADEVRKIRDAVRK